MAYTILLVDDDRDFRSILSSRLSQKYNVVEAAGGAEALSLLQKPNEIDVVLLDVMMPGLRGIEILKQVKKIAPAVGTILLTGYATKDVAIDALRAQADEFIEKPAKAAILIDTIEKVIKSREGRKDLDVFDNHGKIEKVKRFVERNFDRKVGLKDAASSVCLSPKYLSRLFKQETGGGFSRYRSLLRIEKAKEWLEKTGYSVSQISDKLSYQNAESFIRAFRKMTGCTPTTHRNKVRGLSAEQSRQTELDWDHPLLQTDPSSSSSPL